MKRNTKLLAQEQFDLLVVGAGIYGAAVAWDAALRGLRVSLIDKGDFGNATSSNSLKIIHGGLRYLQHLDIKRMRESIRERTTLMGIAPHLVHPLPCVMPTYGYLGKSRLALRIGMMLNDLISFDRNRLPDPEKRIPGGRILSKEECLELIPGIDGHAVTGGAFWTDAQLFNSERLLLSFLRSAEEKGSSLANYVKVTGFLHRENCIEGVKAKDLLSGEEFEIRARVVLNTSGGWVDEVLNLERNSSKRVNLSTAMNLVIGRKLLPSCAAGIRAPCEYRMQDGSLHRGSRILFMHPWREYTIVGTYHLPFSGSPEQLCITEKEIENFLKEVNGGFPADPIRREDITWVHKGFLPMDGISRKSGEVTLTKHYHLHDHGGEEGLKGLLSVVGVKYTTARDVADKAVNQVFRTLGKAPPPCSSHVFPVWGGEIQQFQSFLDGAMKDPPKGLYPRVMKHLVYNFGSEFPRILNYAEKEPALAELVPGSKEVLCAEIVHGIREEMAQKLADVVLRRTDLGSGGNPGRAALEACAELMGKELNWDEKRKKAEIEEVEALYIPKAG